MNRAIRVSLLLAAHGCAPSPEPAPPQASPRVAPAPQGRPATPAVSIPAASASGWASYEPPGKRRKKRGDSFEDCVAEMREGAWLGGDPAAQTYQEALEDERAGKLDLARRGYLHVIQRFPASPYVPLTYLAFGELFAAEAPGDPSKWALVQQTYQKVIEYPAMGSGVFAFGQLRLAQAYREQNQDAKALDLSRRAALSARDASQQCGAQIQAQAAGVHAGAGP